MADWIPGINVGNAFKQVGSFIGLAPKGDYDVLSGTTTSNRPGQVQRTGGFDITSGSNLNPGSTSVAGGGGSAPTGGGTVGETSFALGDATGSPTGGAALPVLNQAAINNTQIALDQLPGLLEAALAAEATRYNNLISGFNTQEQTQRGTYDKSTTTNQQNYDANYMDSIRAGIKGMGNLFNLLRGTGAAGGTAQDLVRDTVAGVTSNDIRMGADTRTANQTALDSALSNFLTELQGKRTSADDTRENNERAIRRDNATQMQDLYSKMAGYYSEGGRTAEATDYMNRAGALTPQIAQNSAAQVTGYDSTPVVVQAPELTAFAAPTVPNAAVAPANGQVGSGIFTMNNRKKEQEAPLAVPTGV